jgi:dienelactone hydrolase
MRGFFLLAAGVLALTGLACSSSSTGTASSSSTNPEPTVDAGTPSIAFFDLEDPASATTPVTSALWTDKMGVRLSGFAPSTDVTVTARYVGWGATAVFKTDASGNIDLATATPESGSYSGVDREGLIWSMTASKSDDDTGQNPYALRFSAALDATSAPVATATLTRPGMASDVTCANVSDNGLVGYYCTKKGAPAVGGIVTFGGSEGGLGTGQVLAEYYASLGYPSLGLAYFGATGVPAELSQIPLEYFQTAFTWLAKQPGVAPGKLAVSGGSRGGELALLLGATFPSVTAVVAILPSGVSWGAPTGTGTDEIASWTYQGKALAWVPYVSGPEQKITEPGGVTAYSDRQLFQQSITQATSGELTQATTLVENTQGPILMFAAADDQIWPSCDLAKISMDRLTSAGHTAKYGDTLTCYPDAGHNVTPFSLNVPTTTAMYSSVPEFGETLALGGTPAGINHAARDSDDQTRAFLAKNLR